MGNKLMGLWLRGDVGVVGFGLWWFSELWRVCGWYVLFCCVVCCLVLYWVVFFWGWSCWWVVWGVWMRVDFEMCMREGERCCCCCCCFWGFWFGGFGFCGIFSIGFVVLGGFWVDVVGESEWLWEVGWD